jgi:hypothetical protein
VSRKGAELIFSFANELSSGITLRYRLRRKVCEVDNLGKVLRPVKFLINRISSRVVRKSTSGGGRSDGLPPFPPRSTGEFDIFEVERFGEEMDGFWHSSCFPNSIMVARRKEYLNWRYVENPSRFYRKVLVTRDDKISGFLVLGTIRVPFVKGVIVDWVFAEEEEAGKLALDAVLEYFRAAGLESVSAWIPGHSVTWKSFRDVGFVERRSRVSLMVKEMKDSLGEVVSRHENWYYTLGDSDIA